MGGPAGDPNHFAAGVGVVDIAEMFPLARYVLEVAGEADPNFTAPSTSIETTATSVSGLTILGGSCIRLRTLLGKKPQTITTSTANCRVGKCGDIGYEVASEPLCLGAASGGSAPGAGEGLTASTVGEIAPGAAYPILDPDLPDAVAGGRTATVSIVLRGRRPLPSMPTPEQEAAFLADAAGKRSEFRSRLPVSGVRILREYAYAFGLVAEIDGAALLALSAMPQVEQVYLDRPVYPLLEEGVPLIGADVVQDCNNTGAGVTIAIIDTGIDYRHLALGGCFGSGCKVVAGHDYGDNDTDPMDDAGPRAGHGTHVAGIAAASATGAFTLNGVAPDARLVALKVFNAAGQGAGSNVDAALNWVLTNRFVYNIRVVNLSLGDLQEHDDSSVYPCAGSVTANLIEDLVNAGIAVSAGSGNGGFDQGVEHPACVAQATAVGSVYDADLGSVTWCLQLQGQQCVNSCTDDPTYADRFVCHASSGAPLDVLAPNYKTATTGLTLGIDLTNVYTDFAGTSASAPYVAGAFALMFSKDPTLLPDPAESQLKASGVPVVNPDNGQSYPRINVRRAVQRDSDLDGHPNTFDACLNNPVDNCPSRYNPGQSDVDADGVGDLCDNCPCHSNTPQADGDRDRRGDVCDCAPSDPALTCMPGEVQGVKFVTPTTIQWDATTYAASYNVYRGQFIQPVPPPQQEAEAPQRTLNHACLASSVTSLSFGDSSVPSAGDVLYYLVTAKSCRGEGPAGPDPGDLRAAATPCPTECVCP
jgi:hypothetical protein